jgi:HlyD family secretion protein
MSTQAAPGPTRNLEALRIGRAPVAERPAPRALLRVATAAAALGVAATFGYAAYSRTIGRPLKVQTLTVAATASGSPGAVLTGTGYIVTRHKYITVGTKVLGQIVEEPIEEGQRVRAGDLLARIDDRDYQAQLGQARADLDLAEANARLSAARAARQRELFQAGISSQDDLDVAENAEEAARAGSRRAAAALDYGRFMVAQCVIRSPIAGVVLKKYRELGDTINYGGQVQAGGGATDVVQIADTGDTRAEVDVNEVDIGKLAVGMAASVVPNAYPERPFDASVAKLYPEADRQKGTVKVEVQLREPDLRIVKPEMSVKVSFLERRTPAKVGALVSVPKSALLAEGSAPYVWRVEGGVARRTPVVAGGELENGIEVRSGLKDGDVVVIAPPAGIADGRKVVARQD